VALTKRTLGWQWEEPFRIPEEALARFRTAIETGERIEREWKERFSELEKRKPELAAEWNRRFSGALPEGWDEGLPRFDAGAKLATREASGKVLNAIAARVPEILGGDADLSSSTKTTLEGMESFDGRTGGGRNFHFGVREHAMGSVVNGIQYHGGFRAFCSTFFCFSDYMKPPVRLASLSELPAIYVWTHDSIGVGEDGPTHQPVEHLMALRAVPHLHVVRPADANETTEAWRCALARKEGPTALVLTRQKLPVIDRNGRGAAIGLRRGAYVLADPAGGEPAQALVIATGSEVSIALDAQAMLAKEGIRARVVSMPCWELFEAQDSAYRESVLPASIAVRVSIEAGATLGWSRYLGPRGEAIGVDRFGASAPAEIVYEKLGLTPERVATAVKSLLGR
ncbi:MAG TPA: transketolase C-terminal domain-containing protein, partial [Vicinamibacteria bacterium]